MNSSERVRQRVAAAISAAAGRKEHLSPWVTLHPTTKEPWLQHADVAIATLAALPREVVSEALDDALLAALEDPA